MKKLFVITFAVLFLNGCAQTTSMMGPTYTMAKTTLGQSPTEYITSLTKKENKDKECTTFHSSSLSEIFFETLDEIDCLRDPFSILK